MKIGWDTSKLRVKTKVRLFIGTSLYGDCEVYSVGYVKYPVYKFTIISNRLLQNGIHCECIIDVCKE